MSSSCTQWLKINPKVSFPELWSQKSTVISTGAFWTVLDKMRLLWWFSNTIRLRPLFLKYFMFFFSKFSEARHHKITIFLPFPAIFCTFFIAWVPSNLAFSGTKTTRIFHTRMQSCVQSFLKYDFAQWAKNRKKSFQLCEFYCALIPLFFFVMSGLRWRWKHFFRC